MSLEKKIKVSHAGVSSAWLISKYKGHGVIVCHFKRKFWLYIPIVLRQIYMEESHLE